MFLVMPGRVPPKWPKATALAEGGLWRLLLAVDFIFHALEQNACGHMQHELSLSDCVSRVVLPVLCSQFPLGSPLTEVRWVMGCWVRHTRWDPTEQSSLRGTITIRVDR